ncbi:MAG: DUF4334 domain-containing protein [Cryobacterium sp.]
MKMTGQSAAARLHELQVSATREEAEAFFDTLHALEVENMFGRWRGSGFETGSPFDGLLESYGWYGKRFDGPNDAHPLVFTDRRGLFSVNPAGLPLAYVAGLGQKLSSVAITAPVRTLLRLRATSKPTARLRMMEYRGVCTATMSYDALAINDHFRRVDERTVVGVMDARGLDAPFFFVLHRDGPAH